MLTRRFALPTLALLVSLGVFAGVFFLLGNESGRSTDSRFEQFREDLEIQEPLRIRATRFATEPTIRVALKDQAIKQVELAIDGPYRIRELKTGRILQQGKSLNATPVKVDGELLLLGGKKLASQVEIEADKPPAIWVDGHQYRGTVRLFQQRQQRLLPVNVLPLEQYIACVVDSEMPVAFPAEARKVQAIVARTYALYQMEQAAQTGQFDLFASTRSQKYLGFQFRDAKGNRIAGETAKGREIAQSTRGQIGTYKGDLFCTYYCAVCGGQTVTGTELFSDAVPALKSIACTHCQDAKLYRWKVEFTDEEVTRLLRPVLDKSGKPLERVVSIQPENPKQKRGPNAKYLVKDGRLTHTVTATTLRQALGSKGVASPSFGVTQSTGKDRQRRFVFDGAGHGHGIGLCQWGARGQAQQGKTAEQIFLYYYSGAALTELAYR